MDDLLQAAFNALARWPIVQGAIALIMLLYAVPLARKAMKDAKAPPALPPALPVTPEWLITQLTKLDADHQESARDIAVLRSDVDTIKRGVEANGRLLEALAKLLRRRARLL